MERINTIGISFSEDSNCISIHVGDCPIYLHGTLDEIRMFGKKIIQAANQKEELLNVQRSTTS